MKAETKKAIGLTILTLIIVIGLGYLTLEEMRNQAGKYCENQTSCNLTAVESPEFVPIIIVCLIGAIFIGWFINKYSLYKDMQDQEKDDINRHNK